MTNISFTWEKSMCMKGVGYCEGVWIGAQQSAHLKVVS